MTRSRSIRIAAGAFALALVVAACGDDDDNAADTTSAPATTAAAPATTAAAPATTAAATTPATTAAETPQLAAVTTAPIAADPSAENAVSLNAARSVIGAAALTRGPRWFVVADGELASSQSRREINKPAAAFDAALAEWAPRQQSSIVADDFSAALEGKGHRSGEHFAALDRRGSAQRSLSLRGVTRLSFSDEVMKSLDRT